MLRLILSVYLCSLYRVSTDYGHVDVTFQIVSSFSFAIFTFKNSVESVHTAWQWHIKPKKNCKLLNFRKSACCFSLNLYRPYNLYVYVNINEN